MTKIGTLAEIGAKPGDVVELQGGARPIYTIGVSIYGKLIDVDDGGELCEYMPFRIVSRAEATPKLWRDMTPEEKGAILLAMHDGKKVEVYSVGKWWKKSYMTFGDENAYRIKPEPKVETVHLMNFHELAKGYAIVFTVKDGEPDCTSIKMERLQ